MLPALCRSAAISWWCRECEQNGSMVDLVPGITGADATAAGLLIECRGQTEQALNVSIQPNYPRYGEKS